MFQDISLDIFNIYLDLLAFESTLFMLIYVPFSLRLYFKIIHMMWVMLFESYCSRFIKLLTLCGSKATYQPAGSSFYSDNNIFHNTIHLFYFRSLNPSRFQFRYAQPLKLFAREQLILFNIYFLTYAYSYRVSLLRRQL